MVKLTQLGEAFAFLAFPPRFDELHNGRDLHVSVLGLISQETAGTVGQNLYVPNSNGVSIKLLKLCDIRKRYVPTEEQFDQNCNNNFWYLYKTVRVYIINLKNKYFTWLIFSKRQLSVNDLNSNFFKCPTWTRKLWCVEKFSLRYWEIERVNKRWKYKFQHWLDSKDGIVVTYFAEMNVYLLS